MRLVLNKVSFPINVFLRLGKAGWYCVTKGKIFFFVLLSLFSSDLSLSVKLTSDRNFSENLFGYPLFFRGVLKLCMLLGNLRYDDEIRRRRRPEVGFAQMRVLRMSPFVISSSTVRRRRNL